MVLIECYRNRRVRGDDWCRGLWLRLLILAGESCARSGRCLVLGVREGWRPGRDLRLDRIQLCLYAQADCVEVLGQEVLELLLTLIAWHLAEVRHRQVVYR